MIILNLYVFLWVILTSSLLIITVSKINAYRAVVRRGAIARKPIPGSFDIENSFYKTDATWHDIIFFQGSISGLIAFLLLLVFKIKVLFPVMNTLLGVFFQVILFSLAVYFFGVAIEKLGITLGKRNINDKQMNEKYVVVIMLSYFLSFIVFVFSLV
ncbi:hypothetical protein RCH20_000363 [Psychrobacter sp. PL15]|jgi:hypothetical protein|uniref:hypothetical protein n=1 Tax=unclassified Psychrobacter TaxID=196806 RepID=UPI001AE60006|nr:hypothetical protein [Psychrobacter sp. PL15]MEC5209314.1 hypothetical protein [Psychrobacter sp. PL15]